MSIANIAVIGAGTMGNGIAQVCAVAGYQVTLIDVSDAALERGVATLRKNLERQVSKQTLEAAQAEAAAGRIRTSTDYAQLKDAELVIEAATENLELKKRILQQVAANVSETCVIATNTSSLSVTQLGAAISQPERFIGVHFFNPVPVMGLIELIRGLATSDDTLAKVEAYGRGLGKEIVHANDAPGFIVNRVLMPMINEAIFALGEGVATMQDIDAGCRLGLNHPMGPITLADFIGLDTCLEIIRVLYSGTGDPKFRPAPLLVQYVDAGWVGKKAGRGFYDWTGPEPLPTR